MNGAGLFEPDSSLVADVVPSPNVNERRGVARPDMLVLHYTGLPSFERSIEVLADPRGQVSCHYVVDVDGRIVQMVPEALRAWHAGVSSWHQATDLNSHSVGIEIQNPGHSGGYPDFPDDQMRAVETLSRDIIDRHRMTSGRVVAHSDIAPGRKIDPGEKFDWQRLHRAGIGDWVPPVPFDPGETGLGPGATGEVVLEVQRNLAAYGYGIEPTSVIDERTAIVVAAFQLRFRPARTDGCIDTSTRLTLQRLLSATTRGS
ncbi:MAG: N-acetylmuramoyl-L-alanine amidase [Hyphomicrobiaceae bacterium]|nr:N-acetylmuramoyl-L-alanine amidase [Hyphomicrobiaceae bacterium]